MQRVYSFTSIPSEVDELIINGIINAEFKRQGEIARQKLSNAMEAYERERDFRHMRKNTNHEQLKEKYARLKAEDCKRCNKNLRHKAKETIIFVWGCIICWAEMLGLIKYEYEEGVWKRK